MKFGFVAATFCLAASLVAAQAGAVTSDVSRARTNNSLCLPVVIHDCTYTKDEMKQYLNDIKPMVRQFIQKTWPRIGIPSAYVYIPDGYKAASACDGYAYQDAYEFCPANNKVYVGQDAIWQLYQLGVIMPIVGLAHENGHFVQHKRKVPDPFNSTTQVNFENQADCVSGAWIRFAEKQGWIDREDIINLLQYLHVIADTEQTSVGTPSHGTFSQRFDSIFLGLNQGVYACDKYYPDRRIIG